MSDSEVNAGWYLGFANAINDNGWIVGTAYNNLIGVGTAYLLTPCDTCLSNNIFPVPEPETYAMFMAGLGLMGFIARRPKNDQT
jgi:hypothetical protein